MGHFSMVMVLAYFGRLARNTIWVDHGAGNHAADFGYYIAETYSRGGLLLSRSLVLEGPLQPMVMARARRAWPVRGR